MNQIIAMRTFWNEAGSNISRIALTCATISVLVNFVTFFGVGAHGPLAPVFLMHLITMALMFIAFIKTGYHHSFAFKRIPATGSLPGFEIAKPLVLPAALALGYLLLNFTLAASYGEGYPELTGDQYFWVRRGVVMYPMSLTEVTKHQALELRLFSSAWLFFLLMTAGWDEVITRRLAAYDQLPEKDAA